MRGLKKLLGFASLLLIISSCCKEDNLVADKNQGSLQLKTSPVKPFQGTIVYLPSNQDLPCDCGNFQPVGTFSGSGNLSHLGLVSSKIKPCTAPIFDNNFNVVGLHVGMECGSFIAANGDELYVLPYPYDLLFGPTGAVGNVSIDIVGGTGRFSNASGNFTGTITIDGNNIATFSNINGTISY